MYKRPYRQGKTIETTVHGRPFGQYILDETAFKLAERSPFGVLSVAQAEVWVRDARAGDRWALARLAVLCGSVVVKQLMPELAYIGESLDEYIIDIQEEFRTRENGKYYKAISEQEYIDAEAEYFEAQEELSLNGPAQPWNEQEGYWAEKNGREERAL